MILTCVSRQYLHAADRAADSAQESSAQESPAPPLDFTPILGTWRNCNTRTWGISRARLTQRDGTVWLRVHGVDPVAGETYDWGEVAVTKPFYTDGPGSGRVIAYAATFDLGHARTLIQVNKGHGVSVFTAFTTFTDGSGRLDYLSREFFHRVPEGA